MAWPRVELLNSSDLSTIGFAQLGIDPEFSSPLTATKTGSANASTSEPVRFTATLICDHGDPTTVPAPDV